MAERKIEGIYAPLVGQIVRTYNSGTTFVGKLSHTDFDKTELVPHVVYVSTELGTVAALEREVPKVLSTGSITAMDPLPVGEEHLEQLVADANEKGRRDRFFSNLSLKEKGYFNQGGIVLVKK